jgi:glycerol uptake facilitator-like aquaporin
LNPAVSLAFLLNGTIKPLKFLVLVSAQLLACFFSALFVYMAYYEAIENKVGGSRLVSGVNGTAGIFATYPPNNVSIVS